MTFGPDFSTIHPVPFTSMVTAAGQIGDKPGEQTTGKRAFIGRQHKRRFACLQAAAEAVHVLPEEGESLHCVMSGYYDLCHLLVVLLQRFGSPCDSMKIATLSMSSRNVQELVALYDAGTVKHLDLLTSDFFRKHDDIIFNELVQEFSSRGCRVASARSHCKIITMQLEDGRKYVLEGSPNLRTCRNAEQFVLTRDPLLHQHYDQWLSGMVSKYLVQNLSTHATPPQRRTTGTHYRHAGLGTWAVKRNLTAEERSAFQAWKQSPATHPLTEVMAVELVALIHQWQPNLPRDWIVTTPPAGASEGREYPAGFLAKAVADKLGLDYMTTLTRSGGKNYHGALALAHLPFTVTVKPPSVALVVDDMMTTGSTMKLSLEALRGKGVCHRVFMGRQRLTE